MRSENKKRRIKLIKLMAMRGGERESQQLKTIKDNYGGSQIKQIEQSHAERE